MPEAMTTEHHDFGRLLKTLRASTWLILLLVVIAAAGAYAVSLVTPSRYRSAETLIYLPAGGTTDVTSDVATRDLQTAVGLVQAAPVIAPSAKRLGVTQDELRASVSGVLPANSNLLRIEATAPTANEAQTRAVVVANVFQSFRLGLQRRAIDARINAIQNQIEKLTPPVGSDAAATLRNLRAQLSLATSDRAVANGDFVVGDPAHLPTAAFEPQPTRNAVLGAVAGLLIGVAAAFGRSRLNRRLITVDDVETAYDMPAIGAIPPPSFHEVDGAGRILGDFEGSSPIVEAFRSTRATLSLYSVGNGKPVVIAVTSANGGEGKTTVVANLGDGDGIERKARPGDLGGPAQAVPLRLLPGGLARRPARCAERQARPHGRYRLRLAERLDCHRRAPRPARHGQSLPRPGAPLRVGRYRARAR